VSIEELKAKKKKKKKKQATALDLTIRGDVTAFQILWLLKKKRLWDV